MYLTKMAERITARFINIEVYHVTSIQKTEAVSRIPEVIEMLDELFGRYRECAVSVTNYEYAGENPRLPGPDAEIQIYEIKGIVYIYFQLADYAFPAFDRPLTVYEDIFQRMHNRAKFNTKLIHTK